MRTTGKTVVCFVYLVTDDRGHCKIGIASDPKKRLKQLQCGNPYPLRTHQTWGFRSAQSAYEVEQHIHHCIVRHSLSGEWLASRPEVLERYTNRKIAQIREARRAGGKIHRLHRGRYWQVVMPKVACAA